jgi:hypothetical protein
MSPAQQLLGRSRINPEIAQTIDRKARAANSGDSIRNSRQTPERPEPYGDQFR